MGDVQKAVEARRDILQGGSRVPVDTRNVRTYHTTRQRPETAANQLDYVFASRGFHECVRVRALNDPAEWGSGDHCRIAIEIDTSR